MSDYEVYIVIATIAGLCAFVLGVWVGLTDYRDTMDYLEKQNQQLRKYIEKLEEQEAAKQPEWKSSMLRTFEGDSRV